MKVVLFRPQIPQNTGSIVRTCSVTGLDLILVGPLGFSTSDKMLRRAGLDYWCGVNVLEIDNLEKYIEETKAPLYFFSSKATKIYTEPKYEKNALLIFGAETFGLPMEFHKKWKDNFYTLPMKKGARCLNLSNAVTVVIYEALEQQGFQFD